MIIQKAKPNKFFLRILVLLVLVLPLLFACTEQKEEGENGLNESPFVSFESIGTFILSELNANQVGDIFIPSNDVNVNVNASDGGSIKQVTLFLNGTQVGSTSNTPYNFKVNFPNAGENTLEVEAVDNEDNKSEARASQKVIVDNQNPTLNVELIVNSTIVNLSQFPLDPLEVTDSVTIRATPSDESSGTDNTAVELTVGSNVITDTTNLGQQEYPLDLLVNFNEVKVINVSVRAIDAAGHKSDPVSFSLTVKEDVVNPGPVFDLPTVSIDVNRIEPQPINNPNCTITNCYEATISIPVRVEDETGTAVVSLIVDSVANGRFPIGDVSTFPYTFTLDTSEYPNNDKLTLITKVVATQNGQEIAGEDSLPVTIEVFNEAPPPVLSINSPASGDQVGGIVPVSVTIGQLTNSSYTLDINGDGAVDASVAGAELEGVFMEWVDFTGEVVDEQRLSNATINGTLFPTRAGNYETREGFDTNELANDTYTVRVTLPARLRTSPNGQIDITLIRTIQIDTDNSSRVPPSLLILSPTDFVGVARTIRDPDNAYVSVQATDNTGIDFIELRVFTGEDDTTPSRLIHSSGGVASVRVALPINFNADPVLPNGTDYIVRIVAEDVDKNRTFQDITVNLERSVDLGYELRQVRPIINTSFDQLTPCIQIQAPVPKDVTFSLITALGFFQDFSEVTNCTGPEVNANPVPVVTQPVAAGDTFDHLLKLPGEDVFRPLSGATGSGDPGFGIGFSEKGSYGFITQVITASGDIYITNTVVISVTD